MSAGCIPAGSTAPAVDLHRLLIPDPGRAVLLRVSGESMEGAGLRHGDLLVVDRDLPVRAGQVVVALLEDGFTLKRLVRRGGDWWLEAAHPAYADLPLRNGRIWGVVTHGIRRLHGAGDAAAPPPRDIQPLGGSAAAEPSASPRGREVGPAMASSRARGAAPEGHAAGSRGAGGSRSGNVVEREPGR